MCNTNLFICHRKVTILLNTSIQKIKKNKTLKKNDIAIEPKFTKELH